MDRKQIESIVSRLEHINQKPGMYIGELQSQVVEGFIDGFNTACHVLGLPFNKYSDLYKQVLSEHGWAVSSGSCVLEMRERSMSDDSIIHELLTIEIEVWKRRIIQLENSSEDKEEK
jgi:hypothetical protein